MKKLKDADISDGIKAYNLSRLINGGFKVPDGFVLNESDIIKILSGNTTEFRDYFSDSDSLYTSAVRISLKHKNSEYYSFDETFISKMCVNKNPDKLIQAINYVISCAKDNHQDIFDHNKELPFNIIIQNMIEDTALIGIAFSNAVDENGKEIIRIEASDVHAEKIKQGNLSSSLINVLKNDLNNDDVLIDVYGKSYDYSKMADLAREVYKIEKYYGEPVKTEWCISKGEIFFVQVDTMNETSICT